MLETELLYLVNAISLKYETDSRKTHTSGALRDTGTEMKVLNFTVQRSECKITVE